MFLITLRDTLASSGIRLRVELLEHRVYLYVTCTSTARWFPRMAEPLSHQQASRFHSVSPDI